MSISDGPVTSLVTGQRATEGQQADMADDQRQEQQAFSESDGTGHIESHDADNQGMGEAEDGGNEEQLYEKALHDLIENKERLIEEAEMLERQSAEEGPHAERPQWSDGDDYHGTESFHDSGDSGHIADILTEDGDVSGAIVWSSSGRKFIVMSADGKPVSNLEADQATELVNNKRIAFDGATEQDYFVAEMSSAGVDVDRDRIDIGEDGSTGELLVPPENLIGNERHHLTGEHAGDVAEWTDEVDLNDPESTGPQRIEEIRKAQAEGREVPGITPGNPRLKKISGRKVYRADNILTVVTVVIILGFYCFVLALQKPNMPMTGLWTVLCAASIAAVLMPLTMSIETRERNIGGKFMLTGSLCLMFLVMSGFLVGDAIATGKGFWPVADETDVDDQEVAEKPVSLNFEPSGDIVHLEMTGSPKVYPAVSIGDVLVTTSEAGRANSLVAEIGSKRYVTQTIATIDGLGISAFTVESASLSNPIKMAKSLSIGQDVIVYSTGDDGTVSVEGTTIRSTTFPVGTHGLPESSEVDQVFVDKTLMPGDIVMDLSGRLIGIASESGDGVVTGTSIAKAVNVLTSSENDLYVGIVCRQASINENEDGGAYVENVMTNSPASNAGIMTGDVIVSVDKATVDGTDDLDTLIDKHEAGEQVALGIIRDGKEITLSVTIGRGREKPGLVTDEIVETNDKDEAKSHGNEKRDDKAESESKPETEADTTVEPGTDGNEGEAPDERDSMEQVEQAEA